MYDVNGSGEMGFLSLQQR